MNAMGFSAGTEIPIRVCWIDVAQCKPRQLSEKLPLSLPELPEEGADRRMRVA
jgi:hypothetical protein